MDIEPALVRPQPLFEADVPLAHHACRISGGLEFLGKGRYIARQAEVWRRKAFRSGVVFKAKSMLIHPAHQASPRRRTDGMRGVAIGEAHAVVRKGINVRRRDVFATVHADVGVTEVVCEELEGGTEMAAQVLLRSGVSSRESRPLLIQALEDTGHARLSTRRDEWITALSHDREHHDEPSPEAGV